MIIKLCSVCTCPNPPYLGLEQVVDDSVGVLPEAGDEDAEPEVGVLPAAHGEVVGLRQDLDAVREGALPGKYSVAVSSLVV